jgi:AbrB family looped-hinge helix DNA binding protein
MHEFEIAKTFKVRDSIAVIIPKKIAKHLKLANGEYVKVSVRNEEIVIQKVFKETNNEIKNTR